MSHLGIKDINIFRENLAGKCPTAGTQFFFQGVNTWLDIFHHLDQGNVPLAGNDAKLGLKQAAPEISAQSGAPIVTSC